MGRIKRVILFCAPVAAVGVAIATAANQVHAQDSGDTSEEELFPQGIHYLLPPPVPLLSDPERSWSNERVAYGAVGSEGVLEQPLAYSHKLHAGRS